MTVFDFPLTAAAIRLRVGYAVAHRLLLQGALGTAVKRGSRWFLSEHAVEQYAARQREPAVPPG